MRSRGEVRDGLDDSWFDRPEHRQVAAELRARLQRTYPAAVERGDREGPPPGAAQPGLDDSWFK